MGSLGERIRSRRKELKWSLRVLGERAKLSASYLCEVEKDKRSLGADSLFRLSQALGMPMDQLMVGGGERRPVGAEVKMPAALMRHATEADIPFRHAMCVYWMARTINDHRLGPNRVDLEKWDWPRFYEAVREFL